MWRAWSLEVVTWRLEFVGGGNMAYGGVDSGDMASKGRQEAVKTRMHHDVAAVVGGDACAWCSMMSSPCLAQMGSDRGTRRQRRRVGWGWWW